MARRDPKLIAKKFAARAEKLLSDLRTDDKAEVEPPISRPRTVANESGRTITISTPAAKGPTPPTVGPDESANEPVAEEADAPEDVEAGAAEADAPEPDTTEGSEEVAAAAPDTTEEAGPDTEEPEAPETDTPDASEPTEEAATEALEAPEEADADTETLDAPEEAEADTETLDAPEEAEADTDLPEPAAADQDGNGLAHDDDDDDDDDDDGGALIAAAAAAGATAVATDAPQHTDAEPATPATGPTPAPLPAAGVPADSQAGAETDSERRRRIGLLALVLLLLAAAVTAIVLSTTGDDEAGEQQAVLEPIDDQTEGSSPTSAEADASDDAAEGSADGTDAEQAEQGDADSGDQAAGTDTAAGDDTDTAAGDDTDTAAGDDTQPGDDSDTADAGSEGQAAESSEEDAETEAGSDGQDTSQAGGDQADQAGDEPTTDQAEVPESRATVSGGKIVLEGAVPSQEAADAIVSLAADILGPDNVVNNYIIDPRADDPNLGNVRVDDTVLFEPGLSVVAPDFEPLLGQALALMSVRPSVTMTIVGHTDSVGDDQGNLILSLQRAQAVERWLTDRGIDPDRLTAVGRGETEPIASNDTLEGRQLNRRIQVFLENLLADG